MRRENVRIIHKLRGWITLNKLWSLRNRISCSILESCFIPLKKGKVERSTNRISINPERVKHGWTFVDANDRLYSTGLLRRLTFFTFIVQDISKGKLFQTKVVNKFKFDFDIFLLFPFYIFHGYKGLLITLRGKF